MKQDIYFNGEELVGTVYRPEYYRGYPVRDTAFICPTCLVAWAQFETDRDDWVYELAAVPCIVCPEAADEILRPVPGSLINDWTGLGGIDEDLLALLPPILLFREFNLTLKAIEEIWQPRASSLASTSSLKAPPEQAKPTP